MQLMYVYVPMGLEREFEMQGSVLARFGSHELASCFIAVANEELGSAYVGEACTCIIPEDSKKHGTRQLVLEKWYELIRMRKLSSSYNVSLKQIHISSIEGWDGVRKTVGKVAATECAEALDIVDNLMQEIVI